MRLLFPLLLLSPLALASQPRVSIVPYQGVGAEPGVVERLAAALRGGLEARKWTVVSADETASRERAAAMCGEDVECLSTLGQRLDSQLVVAFGVGRVGQGLMVSALLIDADAGKRLADFSERLGALPADAAPLAGRALDALLAGRAPPVKLVPPEVVPPPVVVAPPPPPARPLRTAAIGTAIGAGALAIGGGVLTVVASEHFRALPEVEPNARPAAEGAQTGLNAAADATMISAGVAAGVALVLFLVDGASP